MSDLLLYLRNGGLEATDQIPDFDPLTMEDSNPDWPVEVIGYQDNEGVDELRRFGEDVITDTHSRVIPKGGLIGQLLRKKASGTEWAYPTADDAGAAPYMGEPSEDGLYYVSDVQGNRHWGTGSEIEPMTVAQFKRLAIIMEFTQ